MSGMDVVLSSNSEEWKPRVAALAELEELVTEGLQVDGYEVFSDWAQPLLSSLSTSLVVQVTDLRSEVVRQSCHLLSFLALHVPAAFTKACTKLFPSLLKVASGTNGVIRSYAAPACVEVVEHVHHSSLLLDLLQELKTSKNKTALALASQLLQVALRVWGTRVLRKYAALMEESIVALLLTAADASTRSTAGECGLLFLDHFPARSRPLLHALDARATKVVNECRREHSSALNAAPAAAQGKGRSDSLSSVDGAALAGVAAEEEEEKRQSGSAAVSRRVSGSVGGGGGGGGGAALRFAYGQRVEVAEQLSGRSDVDDSAAGQQLQGRKGVVISQSQREGRTGEWVGVRLEPALGEGGGEERKAAVSVVYVRASTLRKEGWRVSKMRAPTIDTSHLLSTPPPHPRSSSPGSAYTATSSSSVPPSPVPSSASSSYMAGTATPTSARSTASSTSSAYSASATRGGAHPSTALALSSTASLRKSPSATSGLDSPQANSGRSQSATPSSASSAASAASPTGLRLMSPPSSTSAGRASTSPVTRIPSTSPASAASLSRTTSVLPSSRIPVASSRLPSRAPSSAASRVQSRSHSRAGSGHFSGLHPAASSQPASPNMLPHSPALHSAASAAPSFSLTQPLPSSPASDSSSSPQPPELSSLLRLHRAYEGELSAFVSQVHTALGDGERVMDSGEQSVAERGYVDGMTRLLSEQLTRTTGLLESFVLVKKRQLRGGGGGGAEAAARSATQGGEQEVAHVGEDAWLRTHDNFTRR